MIRTLVTVSLKSSNLGPTVRLPLCSLADHWNILHFQSALFTHSAQQLQAATPSTQQLQQQQTKQQHMRQQLHPQQGQQSSHAMALKQDPALRRKVMINRLLYRSRQRGFLEMDLLVGIWAEKRIPQLSEDNLRQFELILDQENPDLYKWLTGQEQPPADIASNTAYQALAKDVSLQLRDHIDQTARAPQGKAWVRGWDDWNKASETPVEAAPQLKQMPDSS